MSASTAFRPSPALLAPLAAAIVLALSTPAQAALITVDQNTDAHIPGRCSLREAVQSANNDQAAPGTSCAAGGPQDFIAVPFEQIVLTQGKLTISSGNTSIEGTLPGRTLITRAEDAPPFPIIEHGSTGLVLTNLIISNGRNNGDFSCGGGISSLPTGASQLYLDNVEVSGNHSNGAGGGICMLSGDTELTVMQSTISGNTSNTAGGGIALKYNSTIVDSTISGNTAPAGGGLQVNGIASTHLIVNSTITANRAIGTDSSTERGGGGIRLGRGTLNILNSTITRNQTTGTSIGGGIAVMPALAGEHVALSLRSTLVAVNDRGKYFEDVASTPAITISGSHNLVRHTNESVTMPNGTLTCAPGLGTLGNHGGPTQTIPLLPVSCAIDAGNANSQTFDQRGQGFPRVIGTAADIGAFEYSATAPEGVIFADGFEDD